MNEFARGFAIPVDRFYIYLKDPERPGFENKSVTPIEGVIYIWH